MAIQLATGDFLQYVNAGGVFDVNSDYTVFGWAFHDTGNGMTAVWAASNEAGTTFEYWGTDTNGVSSRMSTGGGNDFVGSSIPKDTWFWWAFRRDGDTLQLIVDGSVLLDEELAVGARANVTRYELGHVQGALQAEVNVAYLRIWEAALTDEELTDETFSATPVRSADLYEHYQFADGSLLESEVGSRNFVDFGSASFVADPDLPAGGETIESGAVELAAASGVQTSGVRTTASSAALAASAGIAASAHRVVSSGGLSLAAVAAIASRAAPAPSTGRKLMILRS